MENLFVDQLSENAGMRISPIQSGDFLQMEKDHVTHYTIFNALGVIELHGSLIQKKQIDIHSLRKGIYFIQFSMLDQTQITKPFMKF